MMLFRPEGLIPSARRKAEFEEGGEEPYPLRRERSGLTASDNILEAVGSARSSAGSSP